MPVVCCCAAAGVLATVRATSGANTPSQIILVIFIVHSLSLTELRGSLTIASPLIAVLSPAILDREVAAVEPSQLAQPLDKSGNPLALSGCPLCAIPVIAWGTISGADAPWGARR